MARPTRKEKKIRLNLDLTPRARERLERLKEACDADSYSEVVRRALAALEDLVTHSRNGGAVILKSGNPQQPDERLRVL